MVSEKELFEELEYTSNSMTAFPGEDGWEIALAAYESLYQSGEPDGVANLAEELDCEHKPVRHALVRADEKGYLEMGAYGYELTEQAEEEFEELFAGSK